MPYSFSVAKETRDEGTIDIPIKSDLYHDILQANITSREDVISIKLAPQAVFRVRPVNRAAASISGHDSAILCAQFSPAPSPPRFATGSGDKNVRIWDCDTATPFRTMKGHTDTVLAVSYSPDGSLIASGSRDMTVRIWDPVTGEAKGRPLTGHTKWIRWLAWEPYHLAEETRPRLASASKDCTVRVWDVTSGRVEHVLSGHKASVSCVRWGGTGRAYTSSEDKTIKIWNADQGTLVATLDAHVHWVNRLALSTDSVLRTAYWDHTGKEPESIAAKKQRARERWEEAATFDGQLIERLVSASEDNTIYLWLPGLDLTFASKKVKPTARLLGHQKAVLHVTFSPNGQTIASSSLDNSVKLWSAIDGSFLTTLRGHVGPVYMTCFSADSRLLLSGSSDTTLKVWDIREGKRKHDLPGHKDEVWAVDWAPNGAMAGSGSRDKTVRLWRS